MRRSFLVPTLLFVVAAGLTACGTPATAENPAATVNGTDVSMAAYNKELRFELVQQQSNIGFNPCDAKGLNAVCSSVKKSALDTLIDRILIRDYAASHHIVVTQADIDRQWAIIFKQDFHDQTPVLQAYAKRYGMKPADIKQKTADQMLQDAVMVSLTRNMPQTAPAVRFSKIDVKSPSDVAAVKLALAQGQSFSSIAARLNRVKKSLCSQTHCGDAGWLPDAFVPSGDRSVLTAKIGSVVGPFQGQQYSEFLQITGRNPSYQLTSQQVLRFRQQKLVAWLKSQEKKATIQRNVGA